MEIKGIIGFYYLEEKKMVRFAKKDHGFRPIDKEKPFAIVKT